MLEVKDLYKSYDDLKVLKGVSFSVPEGSVYGLIGKNGAGKTTIMNIMAGLLSADKGEILLNGEKFDNEFSHLLGYLPDLPVFYEYMTASEYLDFLGMNRSHETSVSLLDRVNISGNTKISKMSRGMRQRLGIAATLLNDPKILLLDEPSSALDPEGREEVVKLLAQLKNDERIIIFSSHILSDVERVCDDFGFLNNGVIVRKENVMKDDVSVFTVVFDRPHKPEISSALKIYAKEITPVSYAFTAEGLSKDDAQRAILSILCNQNVGIRSIVNDSMSPDYLFKEINK